MKDSEGTSTPDVQPEESNAFRFDVSFDDPLRRKFLLPSYRLLERLLLLNHIEKLYKESRGGETNNDLLTEVLRQLEVTYSIADADLAHIPVSGPAVVVANHPYGGVEALILCVLLRKVRADARVLANFFLNRIPELRDYCIFVNPLGGSKSKVDNVTPIKDAVSFVRNNGLLGMFPAGEVSHISWRAQGVVDASWSANAGRIIRMTKAPVVPVFIEGHNGPLFQLAGLIHPKLRTAMMPREFLNKRGRCIKICVGSAIPHEELGVYRDNAELMDYLRFRTYILESRIREPARRKQRKRPATGKKMVAIAPPGDVSLMIAEIERLPEKRKLIEKNDLCVFVAPARHIRHVLFEIARLREITFRLEHEGTGKSHDLDRFDEHYLHLFVWNEKKNEVVAAYRMARTDYVCKRFGKNGLYTSTLFRYKKKLLDRIHPGLELGRSFVRPEYQRDYQPLLLLWKGIGQFIVRNPQYKNLFGPVSISSEYRSVSRQLLAAFFHCNNYQADLARWIKPKRPLRSKPIKGCSPTIFDTAVTNVDTISNVISEIETDNKGIPILLKQYLKLGGQLLGFNIDPDFGDVLDGLILVDVSRTDARQLIRFMGKPGVKSFLEYHGRELPAELQ